MSCEWRHLSDIELDELMFGESSEAVRREAERHLAACRYCAERAVSMKHVVELVERWGGVKAPDTLWSKVQLAVQQVRMEDPPVRRLSGNVIAAALAPVVAAALSLALVWELWVTALNVMTNVGAVSLVLPRVMEALTGGGAGDAARVIWEIAVGLLQEEWVVQFGFGLVALGLSLLTRKGNGRSEEAI